ncbi:Urease accessory protein UreF [hydrothermal vent metagenome]|uniref:Urease accessory protein UreF n=1 Tax=hydrothermal vent metagenome TaxID=652676 RepID=A0A3B1AJP1_9ZZZZ
MAVDTTIIVIKHDSKNIIMKNAQSMSMLRLWQLISPALPVGAYAYSQGLEYALHVEWIAEEDDVKQWIQGQVCHSLCHLDIPVLKRLYQAWLENNEDDVKQWSQFLIASRESSELVAEDQQLGRALAVLLSDLGFRSAQEYKQSNTACFATLLSLAAVEWKISIEEIAHGYLWAWLENQVAAAIKLVPLGQTAGQRILLSVSEDIPGAVEVGLKIEDEDIGMLAPMVSIASALHETQYSRLFRS